MSIADNMKTITDVARKLVESDNTNRHQSIIEWQTGEPKEKGRYLITTIDGHIATAVMVKDDLHDKHFFKEYVKAWCKLSDIEPYKESERPFKIGDLVVENRIVGVVVELQNEGLLKVIGAALMKMHFIESMCRKASDEEALTINARWRELGFYYDVLENKFNRYKEEQP